jgi:hypothetical protein
LTRTRADDYDDQLFLDEHCDEDAQGAGGARPGACM